MSRKNSIDIYSDSRKKRKKGKKGKIAVIIIVIILAILILAAAWIWFFNRSLISGLFPGLAAEPATEPTTVQTTTEVPTTVAPTEEPVTVARIEVPDVGGLASKDAYDKLNAAGLKYTIVREYSKTVKAEYVLSQEPEAGDMIKQTEKVVLYISKGTDNPVEATVARGEPVSEPDTTKSPDKKKSGSYILEDSDTKIISKSEIEKLSENEMTLALNEIFARYGRKFKTPEIQAYFDKQDWYKGTTDPEDFDEDVINSTERENVSVILQVMEEKGYR